MGAPNWHSVKEINENQTTVVRHFAGLATQEIGWKKGKPTFYLGGLSMGLSSNSSGISIK